MVFEVIYIKIDGETTGKIKRALKDNITREYNNELMENIAPANVTSTIDHLTIDKFYEPNNINDEIYGEIVKICL